MSGAYHNLPFNMVSELEILIGASSLYESVKYCYYLSSTLVDTQFCLRAKKSVKIQYQ